MPYEIINSKGITYYLHCKKSTRSGSKIFFFSKTIRSEFALDEIPEEMEVFENPRSKLPMLRRKE